MYIRGLIPWNVAELTEAVPIVPQFTYAFFVHTDYFTMVRKVVLANGLCLETNKVAKILCYMKLTTSISNRCC